MLARMDYFVMLLTALGRFFINPMLYLALIIAVLLGYQRVKRERSHFHIRIQHGATELRSVIKEGLGYALLLSFISIGVGLVVPTTFLLYWTAAMLAVSLLFVVASLSPVYTIALALVAMTIVQHYELPQYLGDGNLHGAAVQIIIVTGLFVLIEGVLIRQTYRSGVSPVLQKTKRGLHAIVYRLRKVWLLPVLMVVPSGPLQALAPYWPQFPLGASDFSFVLFPLVIGTALTSRKHLPDQVFQAYGKSVTALGIILIMSAVGAWYLPEAFLIIMAAAVALRIAITVYFVWQQRADSYAVAPSPKGIMIAAVLPNSPAEKMGLRLGECIVKVNGQVVSNEDELYEALQINAAYCKLEVLDYQQEMRQTQHAVFAEDHYRIGIIAADPHGRKR